MATQIVDGVSTKRRKVTETDISAVVDTVEPTLSNTNTVGQFEIVAS